MGKNQISPIFNVSDFIAIVNQSLEYAYQTVEIEGEVSSFKINQDKYVFFDLKDKKGSVNCFMTIWQLRVPVTDGMKVIVTASPKLTQWGKFSLTVRAIRPSGEGAIKKSFEILKEKLNKEGIFALERKRQLPSVPHHVAVISSVQAAGYADFIKIINDRWGGLKIDVAHVQVQGIEAPDQIIKAINYFNQKDDLPEVLAIIRGGGSADDLSTFNDEQLVRAIASSRIPTLVGVGHETDESLADLAADVRAATPSNAAQILVPDKNEIIRSTHNLANSLQPRILQSIEQIRQLVKDQLIKSLETTIQTIDNKILYIGQQKNILSQLNPNTVLSRGYALLTGKVSPGSLIKIETSKKIINAEVKDVSNK